MEQYKKVQVVMLHANVSPLVLNLDNQLEYDEMLSTYGGVSKKHLYFISDDKIECGDWAIADYITGFTDLSSNSCNDGKLYLVQVKDIVLGNVENGQELLFSYEGLTHETRFCKKIILSTDKLLELPQPCEEFIKEYVEKYNKNNVIKELCINLEDFSTIKANVPICKKFWSREEVESLLKKALQVGFNEGSNDEISPSYLNWDEWIEENLN